MTEARDYWDGEAATFDEEPDHGLLDPVTRAAWAALLTRLLPAPPTEVVDLGCGTGSLAVLLAEAGHTVRGLDLAPRMVEAARLKAEASGVADQVQLSVGDAALPPYVAGSADVVVVRHVLWALPEPQDVLRRWADLLRPGGIVVLIEGFWHTGAGLRGATTHALTAEVLGEATLHPLTDPAYWGGPITDERYAVTATRRVD